MAEPPSRKEPDRRSEQVQPLTDEDIKALRKMMEQDARVRWFWESARVWATWATAIAAGWLLFKDAIKSILKGALGGP